MVVVCMFDGGWCLLVLGEIREKEWAARESALSPWRPLVWPCLRLGVSCGRAWLTDGSRLLGDWFMPLQSGLIGRKIRTMFSAMVTLTEVETLAFKLPESDRARLAADLLDSLPGVLVEDDEGLAEAIRRSEEMDRDPSDRKSVV